MNNYQRPMVITTNGYWHAFENVFRGLETLPEAAARYVNAVEAGDVSFIGAVDNLCNVVIELRSRKYFINYQRAGLALKNILKMLDEKVREMPIAPIEYSFGSEVFGFAEAVDVLGELITPSDEGLNMGVTPGPATIHDIYLTQNAGWVAAIRSLSSGENYEASKEELFRYFKSGKSLNQKVSDDEINNLFFRTLPR